MISITLVPTLRTCARRAMKDFLAQPTASESDKQRQVIVLIGFLLFPTGVDTPSPAVFHPGRDQWQVSGFQTPAKSQTPVPGILDDIGRRRHLLLPARRRGCELAPTFPWAGSSPNENPGPRGAPNAHVGA